MRFLSSSWVRCAIAGFVVTSVVVGCTADGDSGQTTVPTEPDDDGGSVFLPPPSSDEDASTTTDSGPKKDGGKTDAGDAGKDSGPPAPVPGTACTVPDTITQRSCGKCGKQETICQAGDAGLVWSEYGPCAGEAGTCLPGTTQACGDCGTQTCTSFCGWGTCTGQPAGHCSPGTIQNTTAGCPTNGYRSRTCGATCTFGSYSSICEGATAVELFAGGPGAHSTFMKSSDGKMFAWGLDADSQLGDGKTDNKSKMIPASFANVTSLAVGGGTTYGFMCAVFGDTSAKCLGYNSTSYTLGDGVTSTSPTFITPTGFDTGVKSVAAGYAHGCGLFLDGSVKCWGYNTYGQLGNGNTTTQKSPVVVSGLTGATALASGYYTVCALKGDAAYCWGYNSDGQVGDGTTVAKNVPTLVIPSGVAQIAPGYYHTCATMTDGTAKCWGDGVNGSLGNGGSTDVGTPTAVSGIDGVAGGLTNVAEVCSGYQFSCARLNDGKVACWGYNTSGQLGNGTTSNSNVPKEVSGITTASKLTCGYYHACAIVTGGTVKCWGDNAYGQIGNGGLPTDATLPQTAIF